jgi:S1-C subfamily serine protease
MTNTLKKRKLSEESANGDLRKKLSSDRMEDQDDYEIEYSDSSEQIFDLPVGSNNNNWQETITKVVQAVVSIKFSHVLSFDTESAVISEATGFIVDLERGLILTNRHVVGPGPFCGYVVFDNHEEAIVKPIYRDAIHDFGFLQFDPKMVKYLKITALELKPNLAKVGTEIRVVGNDAGEKLSILSGFISRLDRNAPDYGGLSYNDFNTEYIQAAASASGGSSGSPVINEDGYVVALQAGGSSEASTDFFLPVFRPLRALKCIQDGQTITRGDIQVEWLLRPFDECRRLGLSPEAEATARELFPDRIGLLVAEVILPEGPADGKIKEGDNLISINGIPVASFIQVDEILDSNVGKELDFVIQRSGEFIHQIIKIGDLHAITPDRFVEVAGASFNSLSYQLARIYCIPLKGVYINHGSASFVFPHSERSGWLLESLDDKPIDSLETFIDVMKKIPDCSKVNVVYRHLTDMHTDYNRVIYIDRHWNTPFRMAVRNDSTGLWDFTDLQEEALPPIPIKPQTAKFVDLKVSDDDKKECACLTRSLVQVRSYLPVPLDSYQYYQKLGYAVVVDAKNGYVLVSRKIVPHDLADIHVVFAESIEVPGEVVFLHPNLNYAIIKYDPSLVNAPVQTPKFGTTPLKASDKSFFVGHNYNLRLVTDDVKVSSVISLNIPPSSGSPRYRGTNLECILLDSKLCHECDSGVLVDNDGTVRAFWLTYLGDIHQDTDKETTYRMGLDVTDVMGVIDTLKKDKKPPKLRLIEAEFSPITILLARTKGVSQEWISKFEDTTNDQVTILSVHRVSAAPMNQPRIPLKSGDTVLSVNGKLVTSMRDFEVAHNEEQLKFKIVRHKQEMDIEVPTIDTFKCNTTHVVFWAGAILQAPHFGVRQLMDKIPSEVYVTRKSAGGPAEQFGILANGFITHINDEETKDIDSFINVVKTIPDNTYVKIRSISFDNIPYAISLRTNYHYFPTGELKKDSNRGKWIEIEHKQEETIIKEINEP